MTLRTSHLFASIALVVPMGLVLGAASCPQAGGTLKFPPPVTPDTTLGAGDVILIDVFNEETLANKTFQVSSDGTIDYPLIDRVKVGGLKPEEVGQFIAMALMEGGFLLNPQISVIVSEYHSKRIHVLGEVKKPGTFSYNEDMTLVQAITLAGGFTALAKESRVSITRKIDGEEQVFVVDVKRILSNKAPNIPLQAGDIVFVPERIF